MPTALNPIITNAGYNAAVAQSGSGLQLAITHVQLGSGGYALNTAPGSADFNRASLVTPKETVAVAAGHVESQGFRVDAQFQAWTATAYGANEIGFWAGDPANGGVLFAYFAQVAAFTQRNNIDYLASFAVGLARVPDGSVTVSFDPDLQKAVALTTYHEQAADPHPQYKKHQFLTLREYSADTILTAANDVGCTVAVTGARTITLPLVSTVRKGETITVLAQGSQVTVQRQSTNVIRIGGTTNLTSLLLNGSESAELTVNAAGEWVVTGGAPLAPKLTGQITYSTSNAPPGGAIKGNGAILSRTTYAALWAWAQASGLLLANDAAWSNDQGKYSPGDGTSTFRIPDLRGMSIRAFDDGRGIDTGRTNGSYQADALLNHGHVVNDPPHAHGAGSYGAGNHTHNITTNRVAGVGNPDPAQGAIHSGDAGVSANFGMSGSGDHTHGVYVNGASTGVTIQSAGSAGETRVKNNAYLACIYY